MKDLFKLVSIQKRKGLRSIPLVHQNFRKKEVSKDNLLYINIVDGKVKTDEDAAQELFGSSPSSRNYRNAKNKLKTRLLNHLFFLDYDREEYSLYEKVRFQCLHRLHQCEILVHEEANELALKELLQIAKTAKEFEFADIVQRVLTLLLEQYALLGKITLFSETEKELDYWTRFREQQELANRLDQKVQVHINKSQNAKGAIIEELEGIIKIIKSGASEFKSKTLEVLAVRLEVFYKLENFDFEGVIALCDMLEEKFVFAKKGAAVQLDPRHIAHTKLLAFLRLNKIETGLSYAESKLSLFKSGTKRWFEFNELRFLLATGNEDYVRASQIFREIRTNRYYSSLNEWDRKKWDIYKTYLVYFNDEKTLRWGFDLESFLAMDTDFPRNYQKCEIAILILQFLFLLKEERIVDMFVKLRELKKFIAPHLDKRHNYRISIFIKLITVMEKSEFNHVFVKEKGKNYYNKLLKSKQLESRINELEVVPYEILWREILNILRKQKFYIHYKFYRQNVSQLLD
ncbi:hypothetical protein QQ008_09420 [Fulvivirgaceae bacterium BMA10]|uniref:Uncharacterized protein n=1 Tax=Splendidivirga corallicola TaxID=3051826 RepID=A0ABT8KLI3_9BACT|nr:hypothetical protein [Fulvivirgaceae bacterium BMA10]